MDGPSTKRVHIVDCEWKEVCEIEAHWASPLSAAELEHFRRDRIDWGMTAGPNGTPLMDIHKVLDLLLATIDAQNDEVAALQAQVDALTRALNQQGHIAEFREDGYGLEHPVECRVAGLLNCAVDKACRYEQAPPAIGRYRVSIDAEGFLILGERVE